MKSVCSIGLGIVFAVCAAGLPATAVARLPHFPPAAVWQKNISTAPVDPHSTRMLNTLASLGGWGHGNRMQIDFALTVLHASTDAPSRPLVEGVNGYYEGECAAPGFPFPLPAGGAIEDSPGYQCDPEEGDCHLLVVQGKRLYESYGSDVTAKGVESTCAVVWKLDKVYPPEGRGDHCTSADAAGFPIAPLLLDADEVAEALKKPGGDLGHALRFILPNARIAANVYVRPASHAGGPEGAGRQRALRRASASEKRFRHARLHASGQSHPAYHAALRHHPRRRRQYCTDRSQRPLQHRQMARPRHRTTHVRQHRHPAQGDRFRGHRHRPADSEAGRVQGAGVAGTRDSKSRVREGREARKGQSAAVISQQVVQSRTGAR